MFLLKLRVLFFLRKYKWFHAKLLNNLRTKEFGNLSDSYFFLEKLLRKGNFSIHLALSVNQHLPYSIYADLADKYGPSFRLKEKGPYFQTDEDIILLSSLAKFCPHENVLGTVLHKGVDITSYDYLSVLKTNPAFQSTLKKIIEERMEQDFVVTTDVELLVAYKDITSEQIQFWLKKNWRCAGGYCSQSALNINCATEALMELSPEEFVLAEIVKADQCQVSNVLDSMACTYNVALQADIKYLPFVLESFPNQFNSINLEAFKQLSESFNGTVEELMVYYQLTA